MRKRNQESGYIQLSFDDLEEWRDIPGYEGTYQASTRGRIRRIKPTGGTKWGMIMKPIIDHKGYERLRLHNKSYSSGPRVHALVAAAFIGSRPDDHQVNHIDGNKRNNRPENLEYVTNAENMAHAIKMGIYDDVHPKGSKHPSAKINEEIAREIKIMIGQGYKAKEISLALNVKQHMINNIKQGAWSHVTIEQPTTLVDEKE